MDTGIPKKIGRYVIDRLLGAGAMGYVYLGRDPELDRPVAVKTLRNMHLDERALERFLERFKNEARAAARLQHPAIVQVYDVGEDEGLGPYLVFEYVGGSTLKQILRDRGPLEPAVLVRLAEQVADALDTAHEAEIIHRDIKPENLLVTPDGRAKLADFGVARVPNAALTREGQFLGTPCYAAPETLKEGQYGPQSDLFSFAALLYEGATGVRAFPGDDAVAVASKVLHDEPPTPSEIARGPKVPKAVDAELMRGLSKDPNERHATATELASALRDAYVAAGAVTPEELAVRPETGRVRTPGPAATPPRPAPARRAGGGLAFAAVLLGGLGVGVALIFAFDPGGADGSSDAGIDALVDMPLDAGLEPQDAGPVDAGKADAGEDAAEVLLRSPGADAGAAAPDAAAVAAMTPHEREEAAKDALARARRAIEGRRWKAARRALDEARRYDPENPDIGELSAQLP